MKSDQPACVRLTPMGIPHDEIVNVNSEDNLEAVFRKMKVKLTD